MPNKFFKTFFIVAVFLLLPNFTFAAPSISGVSGTLTHDDVVTVNGSGFGTKSTVAPDLWDTVENQPVYIGLQDGDIIPVGGSYPWGANSEDGWSNDKERYESTDIQRGISTVMYKSPSNASGYLGNRGVDGDKIYLSWWEKINITLPVISRKCLRISDFSDLSHKTFSWTDQQSYVYINGCYNTDTWQGSQMLANTWYFREVYIDSSAKTLETWQNGHRLLYNDSWGACEDATLNSIWKLGFDEDYDYAYPTTWMDDIYLDNTPARVMICSGSTWINKGDCEMQIPQTNWNNNELQIKVNQGNFVNDSNAYLYVTDSNNSVNDSGFLITISSGGLSDTTAPSAPSGLGVL